MRLILLVMIMVVAVIAGVVILKLTNTPPAPTVVVQTEPQPQQNIDTVDVLVARDAIPIGTVIEEAMIDRQPWPSHLVLEGFIVAGDEKTNPVGKMARGTFQAREPLLSSKLAGPEDGSFLAGTLPEGKRAITLAVDAISGVAGYIFPGDRVDVLLTHNLPQELSVDKSGGGGGRPSVTEVVLPNLKVIGINLRGTVAQPNAPPPPPSSVTLEVTEAEAQALRLAEKAGTLSLSLRSIKDLKNENESPPTIIHDLSHAGMPGNGSVLIVRGSTGQAQAVSGPLGAPSPRNMGGM